MAHSRTPDSDLLDLLGGPASARLVGVSLALGPSVPQGFVAGPGLEVHTPEILRAVAELLRPTADLPVVHRHPFRRTLVAFEARSVETVVSGIAHEAGQFLLFDACEGRVVVWLADGLVVDVDETEARAWEVPCSPPVEVAAPTVESTEVPEVEVDALSVILHASPWVWALASGLAASPRAFERLAAAGCFVRFAAGPWAEQAVDDVTAWVRGVPPEVRRAAEADAAAAAGLLADSLALLEVDPPPDSRALLLARDDLESAWVALRLGGDGSVLRAALGVLDAEAERNITALEDLLPQLDSDVTERVAAVACSEPDAWWGRLA